jgi:hypothetical protein
MKVEKTSYERPEFFLLKQFEDVAVLKLGKNFLPDVIESAIENPLLDVFDHITENDEIKSLVIINCVEQIGCEEYIDFCRQVIEAEADHRSIQRMCNNYCVKDIQDYLDFESFELLRTIGI